ncbi:MAG: hypothetical protein AMXMBFR13_00090 [Phycisphaerae bacterium]
MVLAQCAPAGAARLDLTRGWKFRVDAQDAGRTQEWFVSDHDDAAWTPIDAGRPWEQQGHEQLDGAAWYRRGISLPPEWAGRPVYLGIESVDDGYDLYINGQSVRSYHEKEHRRRTSTAMGVTSFLRPGEANVLALRVVDRGGEGGLTGRVMLTDDKRSLNWEPLRLPLESGWRFRTDPDGRGLAESWFSESFDDSAWSVRSLQGDGWKGWPEVKDYAGEAWYRLPVELPVDWRQEPIWLRVPSIHGARAVYLNGQLVASHGFSHPPEFARFKDAREESTPAKGDTLYELTRAVRPDKPNLLVVRVKCEDKSRSGIRSPVMLAADRRALIFSQDWSAVTALARAEPGLILPGWATGRGSTHTIVGSPGSTEEGFAAPDGSFSPSNRSYSVTAWVYDESTGLLHAGERLPLEAIEWRLEDGRYPFPKSAWRAGPAQVETLLFVGREKVAGEPRDLAFYRCEVRNTSNRDARVRLFVAVRPYSIPREHYAFNRGYEPVHELAYLPESDAVTVNGMLGLVSLRRPDGFGACTLVGGADICEYAARGVLPASHEVYDGAGLASGAMQFAMSLAVGKSETFEFVVPVVGLEPNDRQNAGPAPGDHAAALRRLEWKKAFNTTRDRWKRLYQDEAIRVRLPDADAEEAFYASLAYMLVLQDGDSLIPGSFAYNAFWTRDAAYLIDACLRAGLVETARKATELWPRFQKESGEFPSMGPGGPKEWDAQGQAIYSFVQVYRVTKDRAWLERYFSNILRGARFIGKIRRDGMTDENRGTPLWGILTPSVSAEDLGPHTWHHYWDDFWCIRGLQDALYAARELGQEPAAAEIRTLLEELHGSTLESIRAVMAKERIDFIPVAPESTSASGRARGTSPAIWPGGAFEPDDPLIRRAFDVYWETQIAPRDGGYWHAGQPWPYATLELAHCYLNLGQIDRAFKMLRWTLDNQSAPGVYGWAEVADGRSKLFLGGDIPHGWASAEYVSLVRDMLVREVGDALHLAAGVPEQWLAHGQRVEVERALTHFGRIGFRLTSQADKGEIELSMTGDANPPGGMFWRLPRFDGQLRSLTVDGLAVPAPADGLMPIPQGARQVRLRFQVTAPDARAEPYRARMARWRAGLTPENVYATADGLRPLLGVFFYFVGADSRTNAQRLREVRESFDFVQIEPRADQVDRCESAGVPWMGVDQPAIPLGRDSEQWNSARGVILDRTRSFADRFYLLGWNDGSEPHTSFGTPGYTGHNEKIYDALGVSEPTRTEFLEWLTGEYADASPDRDTNGDGITFNGDFGVSFDSWAAVAQPQNRKTDWFEHVLTPFRCKLIRDCEAGRIALFRQGDPGHKVTPRLLRSLADPRMSYDLNYLDLGDAAGVTFYCGGGFHNSDPHDSGCRIELRGAPHEGAYRFGLRLTPPYRNMTGRAEVACRVLLPAPGSVKPASAQTPRVCFKTWIRADGRPGQLARIELIEDLDKPDAASRRLLEVGAGNEFVPVEVDLSAWAGRRVWLRLVAEPAPGAPVEGDRLHWLDPRIEAGGRVRLECVDFYKEARAGYRLRGKEGSPEPFVWLGIRSSAYHAWYADHVMSLVANKARLAGKRAVANEFHPGSGSADAMFPFALYDSMIRLMRFRVPSVAFFCDMYKGEFTHYSMADSREHVARVRNQLMLWNAYRDDPEEHFSARRARVACFMPSAFATPLQAKEAAAQFGTGGRLVWALGELGADFFLLNDLDQAEHYDRVVIFTAWADRAAEEKLHAFLLNGCRGKRVLVLTGVSRLWGPVGGRLSKQIDASLGEVLPVTPAGTRLVQKTAEVLPGIRARMSVADAVVGRDTPGFELIQADDGAIIGAVGGRPRCQSRVLCLAGFPETLPEEAAAGGPVDSAIRRLIHRWLDVEPGLIEAGMIRMVTKDMAISEPGLYCVENSSVLTLGEALAGYEIVRQNPVDSPLCGPAVVRVWRSDQCRLVDTDICTPQEFSETDGRISALLVAPESLRSTRSVALTIYWPKGDPDITVGGAPVLAESLGGGFFRMAGPAPGAHELRVE